MTTVRQIGNGRYTLARELGRGGMGVVWLAHDTMLGRDVAIKELLLPSGIPAGQHHEYRERVLREARIASRLTNPGIVTVYDLLVDGDDTYIVMELVRAPTLSEYVEQYGRLTARHTAKLASELLGALEVAHDAGVVHRDVKPGNVMVPDKGTTKLADFGIAQSYEDSRITSTGMIIGSPAYMSPERLEGGDASPAWDLWALGATLYFAVEGRGAFERGTTTATILAVMTDRPQLTACDGPLADLINGLLERDPARRLDAARARDLIEHALRPDPTTHAIVGQPLAPPTVRIYSPNVKEDRRGVIVFATIAVVGVVAGIIFLTQTAGSNDTPAASSTTSSSSQTTAPSSSSPAPPPSTTTSSSTAIPLTSKAMQPMLTYGPGGDIASVPNAPFCWQWVVAKGKPAPKEGNSVGCYGPHDVETFDTVFVAGTGDIPYPTPGEMTASAVARCTKTFFERVTYPDKENTLRYWVIVPSPDAFKAKIVNGYMHADRLALCVAGKADGTKLTQPVK